MRANRLQMIEQYVEKNNEVSMKDLQSTFNISMSTLRMDIAQLASQGIIKKVYGGVVLAKKIHPFTDRMNQEIGFKHMISKRAAELISSGDTVYIDYGTTTMDIPVFLNDKTDITIITPNMHVVQNCIHLPNINLIVLPGVFLEPIYGMLSENTIKDFENYNIGKAFMACSGILGNGGICVARYTQQNLKESVMRKAPVKYLLADSTKFFSTGALCYSNMGDFTALITDSSIREEHRRICELAKVPLFVS